MNLIKFTAQVSQVKTMADGGLRVVLDLPETAIQQAGELMQVKQGGAVLEVVAVPIIYDHIEEQLKELTK